MPKLRLFCTVFLALTACALTARADASVSVYLSSPFAQTAAAAGYTGTTNATFDTATTITDPATYPSPIGKFSPSTGGSFSVNNNNQFGGGGQGGYLAIPAGPAGMTTLTLGSPVSFLSLEWCAIDGGNKLTFFDASGNNIGTFTAATINNYLGSHPTVTLNNGSQYANSTYLGQPNADGTTKSTVNDTNENFGYVSFFANGTAIKSVQISETGATFESDNWSILNTAPTPSGAAVLIAVVPEPSMLALFGLATSAMVLTVVRRRRAH